MYLVWSRGRTFLLWTPSSQLPEGHGDNHVNAMCRMMFLWKDHRNCHLLGHKSWPTAGFAWADFETRCCFSSFLLLWNVPHGTAKHLHPQPRAAHLPAALMPVAKSSPWQGRDVGQNLFRPGVHSLDFSSAATQQWNQEQIRPPLGFKKRLQSFGISLASDLSTPTCMLLLLRVLIVL